MKTILFILGGLQIAGGVLVAASAVSAIHEILATAAFGMGAITLGLATIIDRLDKLLRSK